MSCPIPNGAMLVLSSVAGAWDLPRNSVVRGWLRKVLNASTRSAEKEKAQVVDPLGLF